MTEAVPAIRLRQAVLVARELDPLVEELRGLLGLAEPFRDPGVGEFGLANAVFALGDCFLEIVSPLGPGTAAGRHLERTGRDGGYMVLFDLEDLEGARARAERLGIRVVWRIDLPDISGTHLHPADMRGAIVSLDRSTPYGTWRWGGPDWTGRIGQGPAGRLRGVKVSVEEPSAVAARWGEVLGVPEGRRSDTALAFDGAELLFVPSGGPDGSHGIVEIALELPAEVRAGRETIEVGGATLRLSDLKERPTGP
jgi:hypothetical protein